MRERIPAIDRLNMTEINKEWELLIAWLPELDAVSKIDAKRLVKEQWDKTREAYKAMGESAKNG